MDHDTVESELRADDEATRLKAIKQIITAPNLGEPDAIRFLKALNAPLKDSSVAVRYYAKKALSRLKSLVKGQDRHIILPELLDDELPISRETAPTYVYGSKEFWFYELGSIDFKMRVKAVMEICRNLIANDAAYEKIKKLLAEETHEHVIATLVKYMPRFKKPEIFELIVPYLKHPDWRVRANCVEGLETLNDPRAVAMVLPFLTDQDNRVKGNALKYLVASHVPEVQKSLRDMLESPHEWMRDSALYLLNRLEIAISEDLLLFAIRDSSPDIALRAIQSLEQLASGPKAANELRALAGRSEIASVKDAAKKAAEVIEKRV